MPDESKPAEGVVSPSSSAPPAAPSAPPARPSGSFKAHDYNRRAFARKIPNSAMTICLDKWGMGKPIPVEMIDLSQGGARFSVKKELKKDQEIRVDLVGIGSRKKMHTIARVVKCIVGAEEDKDWVAACVFDKRIPYEQFIHFVR